MTGFRVASGNAQVLFGVKADVTCLGKIIGGGLPVGAYGGNREIMKWVAPWGPAYQALTLSGNQVAVAAGIATLRAPYKPDTCKRLEQRTAAPVAGLRGAAPKAGTASQLDQVGSMFTVFLTPIAVTDLASGRTCDTAHCGKYFRTLLERNVHFPSSQFEACFVSPAHAEKENNATIRATMEGFEAAGHGP